MAESIEEKQYDPYFIDIFRAWTTCRDMLLDRGYTLPEEFMEVDNSEFYELYQNLELADGFNSYDIVGTKTQETVREYSSKFGFIGDDSNTRQSQLVAELIITRNLSASIFRYFLPIIVVLAVTLITTKLDPAYWEAKLATPSTAILSLLFLQDGFRSDLPTTSYLSVLDFYFGIDTKIGRAHV